MLTYFTILAAGLLYVLITIIIGAWASKKFDFNFAYLSVLSILAYLYISYTATLLLSPMAGITIVGVIGLFEAMVGLKLMVKMGIEINTELDDLDLEEELEEDMMDEDHNPHPSLVLMMLLGYMFIGWIGSLMVG